jgi:hypothetical protein
MSEAACPLNPTLGAFDFEERRQLPSGPSLHGVDLQNKAINLAQESRQLWFSQPGRQRGDGKTERTRRFPKRNQPPAVMVQSPLRAIVIELNLLANHPVLFCFRHRTADDFSEVFERVLRGLVMKGGDADS